MKCDAIILAGGMGTRLRSVVADRPKVLANVCGRPFLMHLLDQVAASKVDKVVISTGYMADSIEAAIGESYGRLDIVYSQERSLLGTGGALRLALDKTHGNPILAMNGDSYCACDLDTLLASHLARKPAATLLLAEVADTSRFGRVELDESWKISQFAEKGAAIGPGWINAGVYCFDRSVVSELPADTTVSLEREVLPLMVGRAMYGFRGGEFIDIGTPASYARAAAFFQ